MKFCTYDVIFRAPVANPNESGSGFKKKIYKFALDAPKERYLVEFRLLRNS